MNRAAAAIDETTIDVDDCWNRIGTRGDRTCERLNDCLRCLNCPVYAYHAAKLLERPLDSAEMADTTRRMSAPGAPHVHDADADTHHAALAFRVADEWLALPIGVLREIAGTRPIHSLPHRRHSAVRGVVNIRGTLRIAISIGALLGLDTGKGGNGGDDGRFTRLLVAAHRASRSCFRSTKSRACCASAPPTGCRCRRRSGARAPACRAACCRGAASRWACWTTTACSTQSHGACDERR